MEGYLLTGYLKKLGLRGHAIEFDEEYVFPSREFILGPFSEFFHGELSRKGLLRPRLQSNDCEDFALRAMLDAKDLHHKTHPGKGLAFGAMQYRIGGFGGIAHWINLGIEIAQWEPVVLQPFYYEPQERREKFLTQPEIETCEYQLY